MRNQTALARQGEQRDISIPSARVFLTTLELDAGVAPMAWTGVEPLNSCGAIFGKGSQINAHWTLTASTRTPSSRSLDLCDGFTGVRLSNAIIYALRRACDCGRMANHRPTAVA